LTGSGPLNSVPADILGNPCGSFHAIWRQCPGKLHFEDSRDHARAQECLRILLSIGLDVLGGNRGLRVLIEACKKEPNKALPTWRIVIVDAAKARKYLNIGI
jgi:hypothetical protein